VLPQVIGVELGKTAKLRCAVHEQCSRIDTF
jgi:hypothetical protein